MTEDDKKTVISLKYFIDQLENGGITCVEKFYDHLNEGEEDEKMEIRLQFKIIEKCLN